jgi:hypothetical protein
MQMTFWRVTMRRSVKLSKSYVAIGIILAIYGVILSNLLPLLPVDSTNLVNTSINLSNIFPILAVALLPLAALLFSMSVVMLFVYDKNNGIFEYLLSTGLDQLDIFKGYVKASLLLATSLLTFAIVLNTAIGILLGTSLTLLASIAVLTFAIGVSTVFLVTVCMIAFSSLQKTRVGANSPLGVTIGIIPVFPSLILPLVFPSYALIIDILIAVVILFVSVGLLLSIGKLIMREKLLP